MAQLSLLQKKIISDKVSVAIDNLFDECHKDCHTDYLQFPIRKMIEVEELKDDVTRLLIDQIEKTL